MGLFSAKPDHPLADAKEAKHALAELPAQEPAAAADSAAAWLESLVATDGFQLDHRLDLVLRIDEAVLPQLRRLVRDYLTQPRLTRGVEHKLWQVNRGYWAWLVDAYEDVIARAAADPKAMEALKGHLALLYARLLHAYGNRLKWDQFRYGPIDNGLWLACGRSYLAAAQAKLAQQAVTLYPNAASTPEAEYLKVLIFQASSMDNLLPIEIEVAERLIAHLLPRFTLTDQVRPENVYWFDAGKALPPTRLAKLPEITPTLRFFTTGQALEALAALRAKTVQAGEVPADVNFGGQYAPRIILPVVDHLATCWAPKPPMRNHDRRRIKSRIGVIGGLKAMHQKLLRDDRDGEAGESWLVDDISMGGMGAQISAHGSDWARIGAFLAMQPEGGSNWLVGVIRRFTRESDAVAAVGIETLSKAPRAAVGDSRGLQTEVILLDPLVAGDSVRVLLADMAWEDDIPLQLNLDGQWYQLSPQGLLESGADCAVGRYKVISA
ncbi:MAG TPA: hypothetical protein VMB75_11750 [Rhodocyclaceae bacterium]|nr:hypothetical protein [Rhodocyclaceae bacterium]